LDDLLGTTRRLVNLSAERKDVGKHDTKFRVPKDIDYLGINTSKNEGLVIERGDTLSSDLDVSASLSGSYGGISAEASAKYSYHTSLSSSSYYAIVLCSHDSFQLSLRYSSLEEKSKLDHNFIKAAKKLPDWKENAIVYETYIDFFQRWGTHIIRTCTFGARYRTQIEASTEDVKSKKALEAHVKAEYNGVASVKGETEVKSSEEYKAYTNIRRRSCFVKGGKPGFAADLDNSPDDKDKYTKWAQSISESTANDAVSIGIVGIDYPLSQSSDPQDTAVAKRLADALRYISSFRSITGGALVAGTVKPIKTEISLSGPPGMTLSFKREPQVYMDHTCEEITGNVWKLSSSLSKSGILGHEGHFRVSIAGPPKQASLKFRTDKPGWACVISFGDNGGPLLSTSAAQGEWKVNSFFATGQYEAKP
jgi:hypothetical protein